METLGEFLRRWRKRSDLTQDEAGDAVGVTRQTIANWESGNSTPTAAVLAQLLEPLLEQQSAMLKALPWVHPMATRQAMPSETLSIISLPSIDTEAPLVATMPLPGPVTVTFLTTPRWAPSKSWPSGSRMIG